MFNETVFISELGVRVVADSVFFGGPGEPRVCYMLSLCCTAEPHPRPLLNLSTLSSGWFVQLRVDLRLQA